MQLNIPFTLLVFLFRLVLCYVQCLFESLNDRFITPSYIVYCLCTLCRKLNLYLKTQNHQHQHHQQYLINWVFTSIWVKMKMENMTKQKFINKALKDAKLSLLSSSYKYFFSVGPLKESIFLTPIYGHHYTHYKFFSHKFINSLPCQDLNPGPPL